MYLNQNNNACMSYKFDSKNFSLLLNKIPKYIPTIIQNLDKNVKQLFLKRYFVILLCRLEISIYEQLFDCKIIDSGQLEYLKSKYQSLSDLVLIPYTKLSQILNIPLEKARVIHLLVEFHYSFVFNKILIYYAHPKEKYNTEIEQIEYKNIQHFFPFAFIINPSKLEPNWKKKQLYESEIMDKCLYIVKKVDLVLFSSLNEIYISRGVYLEVTQAEEKKIPVYLIQENDLLNYSLNDKYEENWKKYCTYKAILHENKSFIIKNFNLSLEDYLKNNYSTIFENLRSNKKYFIICNDIREINKTIRTIFSIFNPSNIKIVPILGKKSLCKLKNIPQVCHSCEYHNKIIWDPFYEIFRHYYNVNKEIDSISAIKTSTPTDLCPYELMYDNVQLANFIIINKIFFQRANLRIRLNEKIFFKGFKPFIMIFNQISELNLPYKEYRCSKEALVKLFNFILDKEVTQKVRAIDLLHSLIDLRPNSKLPVNVFLKEFLDDSFKYYKEYINEFLMPMEEAYGISKFPYGIWQNEKEIIIQKIDNNSFYNYLQKFYKVDFLNHI